MTAIALLLVSQQVYFGNLHSHTSYSDGSGTPAQAYFHARTKAKLDFLAITEHNHLQAEDQAKDRADGILIAKKPALYNGTSIQALIPAAKRATKVGAFVALYGQEFSSISKGNHINVFDVANIIDAPNGEFDKLIEWLPANPDSTGQPAILQLNHPALHDDDSNEYGRDDFATDKEWIERVGKHAYLIEVLNGPALKNEKGVRPADVMQKDYLEYLALGFRLAPTADQDNHYKTWGTITDARTAVIAPELSKEALLAALRARHVYATEDKNLRLIFRVNDHLLGDVLAPPSPGELAIAFDIKDDDEPDANYKIEIFSGIVGKDPAVSIDIVKAEGNGSGTIEDIHYQGGRQYFFFKVTQTGEDAKDRAWTAPIWFEPAEQPLIAAGKFFASKKSLVYHVSKDCLDMKRIKAANLVQDADAKKGRSRHVGCPRN
jgi:hypothetical protein